MITKMIKEFSDEALWLILSDISLIIGSNKNGNMEAFAFWMELAEDLKTEIDRRLVLEEPQTTTNKE